MHILNEHILIPGVIGEMEDHRNLRSYLLDRENTIKMQQDTIVKNADINAADKVAELRQFMSQQMTVLEKQLGSNVTLLQEDMKVQKKGIDANHGSSLVEINFKFAAMRQEMKNIHEQRNKDLSLINIDYCKVNEFEAKVKEIAN